MPRFIKSPTRGRISPSGIGQSLSRGSFSAQPQSDPIVRFTSFRAQNPPFRSRPDLAVRNAGSPVRLSSMITPIS